MKQIITILVFFLAAGAWIVADALRQLDNFQKDDEPIM